MTTLRTATPATTAMRAVLPRFITPAEIARDPTVSSFAIMEPRFVTGTGAVSQVVNLARPEAPFTQATAANQPALGFDPTLGRETLTFGADRNDHLLMAVPVSYTDPFSFLVVATLNAVNTIMHLIGDNSATLNGQVSVQMNSNGGFRFKMAEASIGIGNGVVGERYALFGSYNGSGVVKSKRLDTSIGTAAANVATPATTVSLKLGHQSAGWGLDGTIDMAAMFSVDILAPAQADLLSRVETMLKQYYGAAVVGGA